MNTAPIDRQSFIDTKLFEKKDPPSWMNHTVAIIDSWKIFLFPKKIYDLQKNSYKLIRSTQNQWEKSLKYLLNIAAIAGDIAKISITSAISLSESRLISIKPNLIENKIPVIITVASLNAAATSYKSLFYLKKLRTGKNTHEYIEKFTLKALQCLSETMDAVGYTLIYSHFKWPLVPAFMITVGLAANTIIGTYKFTHDPTVNLICRKILNKKKKSV